MTPTIGEALALGAARLRAAGIEEAPRDARRLLAAAVQVGADRLVLMGPDPVPQEALARWDAYLSAREQRQPVAQIIGERLFYGRAFRVTGDVLDPRPETEGLVAEVLRAPAKRILDIGTGTGCILLTLLAEWPDATGIGTDRSHAALAVARDNADRLGIARAAFFETDWAAGLAGPFDLIVSNPPYITGVEMAALSPDVRDWEPHLALTPGPEGVESYRALIPQAAALLTPGGRLAMEIGAAQGAVVADLTAAAGFEDIRVLPDLDGRDRVVTGRKPGETTKI